MDTLKNSATQMKFTVEAKKRGENSINYQFRSFMRNISGFNIIG